MRKKHDFVCHIYRPLCSVDFLIFFLDNYLARLTVLEQHDDKRHACLSILR